MTSRQLSVLHDPGRAAVFAARVPVTLNLRPAVPVESRRGAAV